MEPISDTDLATLPVYTYEEVAKQQLESDAQVDGSSAGPSGSSAIGSVGVSAEAADASS